jgi:uncharacterized membrane protein YeaQ/YmgE (transglycosylase-associated protein family)
MSSPAAAGGGDRIDFGEILLLLLIAGLSGALGQAARGPSRGGWFVSLALGLIGAMVGPGLTRLLNVPELFAVSLDSTRFPVLWSILGAALFVVSVSL